jgi:hypothetical protein
MGKRWHVPSDIPREDDLKRRVIRFRGVGRGARQIPKDEKKSTTIRIYDVAKLAGIDLMDMHGWLRGKDRVQSRFGPVRLRRVWNALKLVEGGYVSKEGFGNYIIHDHPVHPPIKEMRVVIGGNGLTIAPAVPDALRQSPMPDFMAVFRRK